MGCSPKIYFFEANTQAISNIDSVQLRWKVRGKPVLLTHVQELPDRRDGLLRRLEYTLVVQKNGKEQTKFIEVDVLKPDSYTDIVFNVLRKGDSLYASGIKDVQKWGTKFVIDGVANPATRNLLIIHENKAIKVVAGDSTDVFKGTPVSGHWDIRTNLSEEEMKDSSLIPFRLIIHAHITHQ